MAQADGLNRCPATGPGRVVAWPEQAWAPSAAALGARRSAPALGDERLGGDGGARPAARWGPRQVGGRCWRCVSGQPLRAAGYAGHRASRCSVLCGALSREESSRRRHGDRRSAAHRALAIRCRPVPGADGWGATPLGQTPVPVGVPSGFPSRGLPRSARQPTAPPWLRGPGSCQQSWFVSFEASWQPFQGPTGLCRLFGNSGWAFAGFPRRFGLGPDPHRVVPGWARMVRSDDEPRAASAITCRRRSGWPRGAGPETSA